MILQYASASALQLSLVSTDPEFHRVCSALGVEEIDLDTMFVTILRYPLTEEMLHAKINTAQHELREAGSQEQLPF